MSALAVLARGWHVLKTGQEPRAGNRASPRVLPAGQQAAAAAALRAFAAAAGEIPESQWPAGGAADPGTDVAADAGSKAGVREPA